MRGLSGRRVLLTGGASGIGRATAIRLAEEGCRVGILDIDADGAARTSELCNGKAWTAATDISDRIAVEAAVTRFEQDVGPIDFLANIAGWDVMRFFLETDPELWDKIIHINLYGPLHLHHVVLPGMVRRRFGRVVNVSSDAGRVGSSGEAVYSRLQRRHHRLHQDNGARNGPQRHNPERPLPGPDRYAAVRAPSPPAPQQRQNRRGAGSGRAAEAHRAARRLSRTIAFLLSDDAAYITGQTISVSGGLTMV